MRSGNQKSSGYYLIYAILMAAIMIGFASYDAARHNWSFFAGQVLIGVATLIGISLLASKGR